jgi:hypothetical protein
VLLWHNDQMPTACDRNGAIGTRHARSILERVMIEVVRSTQRNVKRWRSGEMDPRRLSGRIVLASTITPG